MYDLVIAGGTLVSPELGERRADLAVRDGRIAAMLEPGTRIEAERTIDAGGLHVLPGVIDPHVHIGHGAPHPEDFRVETGSAAIGGVTTILSYFRKEPYDYERLVPELIRGGEENSLIDFGVHIVLFTRDHLAAVPRYAEMGVPSFKFFLGHDASLRAVTALPNTGPHLEIDDAFILDGFRAIAEIPGGLAIAHCENGEINAAATARAKASGRSDLRAWSDSRPDYSETDGVRRVVLWAELAGAPLLLVHMGSKRSADEVRRQRFISDATIYAETLVQYLVLTAETAQAAVGARAKMNPPLRTEADREGLWESVEQGLFDFIASDHGAFTKEEKAEVWTSRSGTPSAGLILPGLLHTGYHEGRISLVDVARLTSTGAAEVFGLYPRKGSLLVGADADLALVDLEQERLVTPELMRSRSDFSVFEGRTLRGWPRMTLSRGEVVVEDAEICGRPGHGCYLRRPLQRFEPAA